MATFGKRADTGELDIEEVPVAELMKKKAVGRQPSPTDLALVNLVEMAGDKANAEKAFAWNFGAMKPLTARAAATRAIERAGQKGKVFVSAREGRLFFSQTALTQRGRGRPKK